MPVLTAVLLLPAAVLLVAAAVLTRRHRRAHQQATAFAASSVLTEAEVVDMRERSRSSRAAMPASFDAGEIAARWYHPVVRFRLPDGQEVRTELLLGSRPAPARVGDTVEIRYDPTDPTRAVMAHGIATLRTAGCVGTVVTAFLWAFGVVLLLLWALLVLVLDVPV